jgi:hypothetical protein
VRQAAVLKEMFHHTDDFTFQIKQRISGKAASLGVERYGDELELHGKNQNFGTGFAGRNVSPRAVHGKRNRPLLPPWIFKQTLQSFYIANLAESWLLHYAQG